MSKLELLKGLKKYFIKRSITQWKLKSQFDIAITDNYELPSDSTSDMNDCYTFFGVSFESDEMFYIRCCLHGGESEDEIWLIYRDKKGRIFVQENFSVAKGGENPFKVRVLEAGKLIRFTYNGFVLPALDKANGYISDKTAKPVPFILDGEFRGTHEPIEFSQNLSLDTLINTFCEESRANLLGFYDIQKMHYEQIGKSKGYISIGGKSFNFADYHIVRIREFGSYDIDFFDRYIRTFVVLENGDVCQTTLSRYPIVKELKSGFCISNGKITSVTSSTSMDDLPVNGGVPKVFTLKTQYEDKSKRNFIVKREFIVPYLLENNFLVCEGFASFLVNGVRGKGITEFGFNANKSRWKRE